MTKVLKGLSALPLNPPDSVSLHRKRLKSTPWGCFGQDHSPWSPQDGTCDPVGVPVEFPALTMYSYLATLQFYVSCLRACTRLGEEVLRA